MKGSQLAVRCERVGYNTGMVANASTQIEMAKRAVLPRADALAGEEKSATVFSWSDDDDSITVSGLSTHELHGFYDQVQSEVASVDQSNQQYSIVALTDSSGNVSERYAYTAYGQTTFLERFGNGANKFGCEQSLHVYGSRMGCNARLALLQSEMDERVERVDGTIPHQRPYRVRW